MASKPVLKSFKDWAKLFVCGICMGAADIVPGISGGTMAFIMGFYENLLASISSFNLSAFSKLFRFRFRDFCRSVGWEFLLALLSGIAFAFITLAHFFDFLLNDEVYRVYLYSAFMGLILASVVFCAKQIPKWSLKHFVGLAAGAIIAFVLTDTHLKPAERETLFDIHVSHVDISQHRVIENYRPDTQMLLGVPRTTLEAMLAKGIVFPETPVYNRETETTGVVQDFAQGNYSPSLDLWLIICGAIAVAAMLLPGISGSYMLTILGAYSVAIGALADFILHAKQGIFEAEAFYVLASLLIGILAGGLLFSRVVYWLLTHYHNLSVAVLTGFMVGALRTVWPFWSYEYWLIPLKISRGPVLQTVNPVLPDPSSQIFWIACGFALLGFFLVLAIEFIAHRKKGVLAQ